MIESWMITALIVIAGVISQFAINRYQNAEFKEQIALLFKKHDEHTQEITELKSIDNKFLTNDKADEFYVRRKEFEMLEKHLDKRFDNMQNTLNEILTYMKDK